MARQVSASRPDVSSGWEVVHDAGAVVHSSPWTAAPSVALDGALHACEIMSIGDRSEKQARKKYPRRSASRSAGAPVGSSSAGRGVLAHSPRSAGELLAPRRAPRDPGGAAARSGDPWYLARRSASDLSIVSQRQCTRRSRRGTHSSQSGNHLDDVRVCSRRSVLDV